MARDFEDIHDLGDLSNAELRALARDRLQAHNGLDSDDITIHVAGGAVTLEGRVGTDAERRIAEHVLTDVLGIALVANNLVVDPLRRAESPVDMDEHLVEEDRTEGLMLGDRPVPLSPEAEHLADDPEAMEQGTSDFGKAISDGVSWIPPESPTQEGIEGTGNPRNPGEDH
jgi:hypothetical protein